MTSSPAIGADGTIYFGSYDDNLYALNPGGTLKWKFATASGVESSPAIGADGTIYVGTIDTSDLLYAVTDGGQGIVAQKWAFKAGEDVESSPAIGADGTIYVGSDDDNLYALNPDGTLKWTFATGAFVYSSPAIGADGTIYVGSEDHNLYAVGIPSPTPTPTATIAPTATATVTATPTPVPVRLEIKPKALKFPKTAVGTSSKPKTVKVSNPKGGNKHRGNPVLVEQISDSGDVHADQQLSRDFGGRRGVYDLSDIYSERGHEADGHDEDHRQREGYTADCATERRRALATAAGLGLEGFERGQDFRRQLAVERHALERHPFESQAHDMRDYFVVGAGSFGRGKSSSNDRLINSSIRSFAALTDSRRYASVRLATTSSIHAVVSRPFEISHNRSIAVARRSFSFVRRLTFSFISPNFSSKRCSTALVSSSSFFGK